jgi:hypothetical protein
MKALLWSGRIICLLMFLFAAPFALGYGMPDFAKLPWYDLVQLALIAAALLGLLMAWRWEMAAGLILTGSGVLSSLVGLAAGFDLYSPLLFCLAPGLLLLAYAMVQKRRLRQGIRASPPAGCGV